MFCRGFWQRVKPSSCTAVVSESLLTGLRRLILALLIMGRGGKAGGGKFAGLLSI